MFLDFISLLVTVFISISWYAFDKSFLRLHLDHLSTIFPFKDVLFFHFYLIFGFIAPISIHEQLQQYPFLRIGLPLGFSGNSLWCIFDGVRYTKNTLIFCNNYLTNKMLPKPCYYTICPNSMNPMSASMRIKAATTLREGSGGSKKGVG